MLDVRTLALYAARIAKMPLSFASSLAKMEVEWGKGKGGASPLILSRPPTSKDPLSSERGTTESFSDGVEF